MNIIYIALKTSFKKQPFFELTSLLKMDLTFLIKFAQKLTSLIKMDLTSLFKTSFKKQPSGLFTFSITLLTSGPFECNFPMKLLST